MNKQKSTAESFSGRVSCGLEAWLHK